MANNNNYTISKHENKRNIYFTIDGTRYDRDNGFNYAVADNLKELIKLMRCARVINPDATFTLSDSLAPVEAATITADAPRLFSPVKKPTYKNLSQDPAAILKYMRKIAKANDRPERKCIYFDPERQMAVATDAMRLIASRAVYEQYPQFSGCMVDFEAAESYPCDPADPRHSKIGRYPNWSTAIPADPGQPLSLYPQPVPVTLVSYECAIGTNRPDNQPVCCNAKWYSEMLPLFPAALCNSKQYRAITSQTEDLIILLMPMIPPAGLPEYLAALATDTPSQDTTDTPTDTAAAVLKAGIDTGHVIICQPPTSQKPARAVACTAPRIITPMPTPAGLKFTPIFATEEAFVRYDNFHCGDLERVPVYFMYQGRRLFVCNMPNEYKTRHDHGGWYDASLKEARQDVENYFNQLNTTGGKYFKFYIVNHKDKTLPEFLEWIKANGYTFDKNMTDFSIEKDYIDFSGNLNEYSAAFFFRIYDKALATHLMNTIDAPRRDYTKE